MRQALVPLLLVACHAFTAPRRRIKKTLLRSTPYDAQKEAYLAEPEFDAVSLRQWRRETLVRYNNANQSEPLRVVLFFLLVFAVSGLQIYVDVDFDHSELSFAGFLPAMLLLFVSATGDDWPTFMYTAMADPAGGETSGALFFIAWLYIGQ